MSEEPETVRMRSGQGPEITVPEWMNQGRPTPEQWVRWFSAQKPEAKLAIAEYHLDIEGRYARISEIVAE